MDNDEKKHRQELYANTRKDLLERQLSNSEKFDSAILTLSTAALGISLAFIKDIVPINIAQKLWLLKTSWWLFGLSIISTLSSFVASQLGISKQLYYAEEYYLNNKDQYLNKKNYPAIVTVFLNYFSGILFVIGIILTIFFVLSNIGGKTSMSDRNKSERLTGGAVINKMQPIDKGDLKKGASIPNMQSVQSQTSTRGEQSIGAGGSGQNSTKK
jgi:hypothetical protein